MQNLKKMGAIGGAISLALCWPLAVGHIGQSVAVDAIEAHQDPSVDIKLVSYDRGYLNSTVVTEYSITDPAIREQLELANFPTTFTMISELTHGLASISGESFVQDGEAWPMTIYTQTQLNGNTDYQIKVESVNYGGEPGDEFALSMSPMTLTGSSTMVGDMNFNFDLPSLQLKLGTGETVFAENLAAEGKGRYAEGYWLGPQSFTMGRLEVKDETGMVAVLIDKSEYKGDTVLDEATNQLTSQVVVTLNGLEAMGEEPVDQVKMDFSLKDIDVTSFNQLMSVMQSTSEEFSPEQVEQLTASIDALFEKGLTLSFDEISVAKGDAKLKNDWFITVPGLDFKVTQNPMGIVSAATGELNLFVNNQMTTDYPELKKGLDELILMEMVEETEEGYRLKANLVNGNIVFENGNEVPIFQMLAPMMM